MTRHFSYTPTTAIVQTSRGKIRGYQDKGLSIFKGVPYAEAKRFHAPQPVEAWEGVLDTTSFGYVCPLLELEKPQGELLVPHRYWIMNENCQNLNIWTPGLDQKKRPVMVWLHGGAFESGSAIEHIAYEGENMALYGDVVVVTVNHRLNILGFFDLSDLGEEYANSGNAGMDDIIAALQWVHDNIALFGGDPDNVIIFGQSGGGGKVTTLLQMPAADGLYAKGINMSGVVGTTLVDSVGSGREIAEAMMTALHVSTAKELEEVPFGHLASVYLKLRPQFTAAGKYTGCCPHPNAYYTGSPETGCFREETKDIPMLIGTVFGEFTSFAAAEYDRNTLTEEEGAEILEKILGKELTKRFLPLFKEAYPKRHPVDLLRLDTIFRAPTIPYIRKRAALNTCTYSYFFDHNMPIDEGRTPWHCADIPYVMHNTELVQNCQEEGVREVLEDRIFSSVMAFARTGSPANPKLPAWPASTETEEKTMIFDTECQLVINHDEKLVPAFAEEAREPIERYMAKNQGQIQH